MDRLGYWLYRAAGAGLSLLSLRAVFLLGEILGGLGYYLGGGYRRLALHNLGIAFAGEKTEAERRALARRHFRWLGGNMFASLRLGQLPRTAIRAAAEVEGLEIVEQIRKEGRGFVFVLSHIGNWELLAQIAPILWQVPLGTVYQRLGNPFIDAEVRKARARQGLELFERKEGFQGAISVLRGGGGVGVLLDQHAGDAGVWVPFFGRLASTTSLAAMMALRTNAALIPIAVNTAGRGTWRMVIHPEVTPGSSRSPEELTARVNLAIEAQIRKSPADWFWVHNRWKLPYPKFLLATYKRGVAANASGPALKPFRVLVRATNWLGDAVMGVPAVRAIKQGRPDLHLAILTPAKLADFWREIAEVDEVIAIEAGEGVREVARKIGGDRFEAAILFPNSLRSALEVWLAGIPRRIGHQGHSRAWLLNQMIATPRRQKAVSPHHVQHYLALAEYIGADTSGALTTTPQAPAPRPGGRRIGVVAGAEYGPAKRWLPERFRATMEEYDAAGAGCEWIMFGVAKDAPVVEEIVTGFPGQVRNLVGQTTLKSLMAELRQCDAVLTNDTGTMHLAALLGVPVVAVFGSTEPRLTGPLGQGHRVLREHVECSPCFLRECPLDFRCMKSVTVPQAVQALQEVTAQR